MDFDILILHSPRQEGVANWAGEQLQGAGYRSGLVPQEATLSPAAASAVVGGAGGARGVLLIPAGDENAAPAAAGFVMMLPARVDYAPPEVDPPLVFESPCWIDPSAPGAGQALCSAVDRLLKSGRSAPPSPPPAHKTAPSGIQLPQPRPSGAPSLALNPLIRAAPAPALVPLAIGPSAGGSQAEVVRKPRDVIFGVGLIVAILALLVTTVLLLPTGLTAIGDKLYYRECLGEPYAKGAFCCYYVASYMGNATAQFDLALMYDMDAFHGVEHDPAAATYWYNQAAAKKNPDALYSLAQVAKASKDSSVNAQTDDLMRRAFERFQELAGKGDVDAMTGLGTMYEAGDGTTLNYDKAHELYQRASDLGYPYADESLAMLYTNGHGVTVDKDKAQELYTKAYADGDFNAQNMKP